MAGYCECPVGNITDAKTQTRPIWSCRLQVCECPTGTPADTTSQTLLVWNFNLLLCECPAGTIQDAATQIKLVWSSTDGFCSCPNVATLPDPTKQVLTVWDSSVQVCKCPDTPSGAVGLTLASPTGPTYCQCPNPYLDAATEVALVLADTFDSCVCPAPAIEDSSREYNLVLASSHDKCLCLSLNATIDPTTQSPIELNAQTLLCQCPNSPLSNSTIQTYLLLDGDHSSCSCPRPIEESFIDAKKYLSLIWNNNSRWCECPNTGAAPDPSQSNIIWNSTIGVCGCPVSINGGISPDPVIIGDAVSYCQCPKVTFGKLHLQLTFDNATYSCVCPSLIPAVQFKQVSMVPNLLNNTCGCPTPSDPTDPNQIPLLYDKAASLCDCP